MGARDLTCYYDKPCKFKFRSGKEVYGVVWEVITAEKKECYFTTSGEYFQMKATSKPLLAKIPLDISEIVSVKEIEL